MNYRLGDRVWARSDGTHVARGWHRGVITDVRRDGYEVTLIEYKREFKVIDCGLRLRHDDADTNLPSTWDRVPWKPAKNWKRREQTNT